MFACTQVITIEYDRYLLVSLIVQFIRSVILTILSHDRILFPIESYNSLRLLVYSVLCSIRFSN